MPLVILIAAQGRCCTKIGPASQYPATIFFLEHASEKLQKATIQQDSCPRPMGKARHSESRLARHAFLTRLALHASRFVTLAYFFSILLGPGRRFEV